MQHVCLFIILSSKPCILIRLFPPKDGPRSYKSRRDGSHSGASTDGFNSKVGQGLQARQGAQTAIGPLKVVSRQWPSTVPRPVAICKRPRNGQISHSQPSTVPVQATSVPSLRDAGDHRHMSKSSELDIEPSVQVNHQKTICETCRLNRFCVQQRDENAILDIDSDLPPNSKATHLIVTLRSTSTFVASLVPDPTTPKPLWNLERYDTSHEVTTTMYLHQSKD